MRKVNYEVRTANGNSFVTANYGQAYTAGNKVIRTFFTDVDDPAVENAVKGLVEFRRKFANKKGR